MRDLTRRSLLALAFACAASQQSIGQETDLNAAFANEPLRLARGSRGAY